MLIKQILFIVFLYFLSLLQSSFFPHFFNPNLILIAVIIINIYESPKEVFGVVAAFFGGFFLDVFSSGFFGYNVMALVLMSLVIKLVIKKNVRIPFTKEV